MKSLKKNSILKNLSIILIVLYFILVIFKRIALYYFKPTCPICINAFSYSCYYIIISLLIWIERRHLDENNIDKYSLIIILIFGSILRLTYLQFDFNGCFIRITNFLTAGLLYIGLRRSEYKLSETRKIGFWILAGFLFVGALFIAFMNFFNLSEYILSNYYKISSYFFLQFITYFLYNFGNTAIIEETIFRGFLWGVMCRSGYSVKLILLSQAILFTLSHIIGTNPIKDYPSYILLFLSGLMLGFLAWKSRSIAPGFFVHAFYNTIVQFLKAI